MLSKWKQRALELLYMITQKARSSHGKVLSLRIYNPVNIFSPQTTEHKPDILKLYLACRHISGLPSFSTHFWIMWLIQRFWPENRNFIPLCWAQKFRSSLGKNLKMAPDTKGKERPEEDPDHSRSVSVRFNEQRNLYTRLNFRWQDEEITAPASQNLRSLHRGLPWVQCCICQDSLSSSSLNAACILENGSPAGTSGRT